MISKQSLAEIVGMSIHTSLRKYTNSTEAIEAYDAIARMPDQEWETVTTIAADIVLQAIKESEEA